MVSIQRHIFQRGYRDQYRNPLPPPDHPPPLGLGCAAPDHMDRKDPPESPGVAVDRGTVSVHRRLPHDHLHYDRSANGAEDRLRLGRINRQQRRSDLL